MIVAQLDNEKQKALVFALTPYEINALVKGDCIHLTRKNHGDCIPEDTSFILLVGESQMEVSDTLIRQGLLRIKEDGAPGGD